MSSGSILGLVFARSVATQVGQASVAGLLQAMA
jgi:hypothetical protein